MEDVSTLSTRLKLSYNKYIKSTFFSSDTTLKKEQKLETRKYSEYTLSQVNLYLECKDTLEKSRGLA